MEVLNLIRLFWGWVFPYITRIHTAYIGEDSSILGTVEMFGDYKRFPPLPGTVHKHIFGSKRLAQFRAMKDGEVFGGLKLLVVC